MKPNTLPLIYNHDGAIDEYMAAVLLDTMEEVDLRAIIVTDGDCLAEPAMDTAWKILSYTNQVGDIDLSLSAARVYNAFPYSYRTDCITQGTIEVLKPYGPPPSPPYPSGETALRSRLEEAIKTGRPVTLVCTCSLTTIYDVLHAQPSLGKGVARLIWMGGAIKVPGNLDPTTIPPQIANPAAEWNVFSDPAAAEWILASPEVTFPVVVFPLDVTNKAKITPEFKSALQAQSEKYPLSLLAAQSYALVAAEPFYELWNVCAVCYIARPELYSAPVPMALDVVTQGFYQGNMKGSSRPGRKVDVVLDIVDLAGFYDYVLQQFRR